MVRDELPEGGYQFRTDTVTQVLVYLYEEFGTDFIARASMSNSLKVRVPFFDTDVFEFAMDPPTAYSITQTESKRVLNAAVHHMSPEEILKRNKQRVEVPIGEWPKEELSTEFPTTLRKGEIVLVIIEAVETIYDEHLNGSKDHSL